MSRERLVNVRSVQAVYGQMAKLNKRCLMMQVFSTPTADDR